MTAPARRFRRHRGPGAHSVWVKVGLFSAAALAIAVTALSGTAQVTVILVSVIVGLFAFARAMDGDDFRRLERTTPSTYNETTMPGSDYLAATGARRAPRPPVGPVNTPRRDEIDSLERQWRSSPDN